MIRAIARPSARRQKSALRALLQMVVHRVV
jgi:hypothetical protein